MSERIELSDGFISILQALASKNKIIEQLLHDRDLNKFKEYLGMLKKFIGDSDEDLLKKNLTREEINNMVQALIKEMFVGPSTDIKCILHNFLKASSRKDPLFQQNTAQSFKVAFEGGLQHVRAIVVEQQVQIFDDPLFVLEEFKAMNWIHELLEMYREVVGVANLRKSFEMVATVTARYAEIIAKQKFVTMKQSELFSENLKVCHYLMDIPVKAMIFPDHEPSRSIATQMMANLDGLYRYSDKLNRDLLFHFSFDLYVYNSDVLGPAYKLKYFDMDSLKIPEDPARVGLVAKVGAYLNHEGNADISEKIVTFMGRQQTVLEILQENCSSNQLNLKQSAFRVLKDVFGKIGENAKMLEQYRADSATAEALFELVMQNWEFPIKGFANAMEDVFTNYLTIFPDQNDKIELMNSILAKYPANSRRKYASLRLILRGVDIDEFLRYAKDIVKEILTFEKIGTAPFVVQLFKELLNQAYLKVTKKYPKDKTKAIEEWTNYWIGEYIDVVTNGSYEQVSEINEFINPQIFGICEKSLPIVIGKLFKVKCKSTTTFQSVQASLLRYARSKDIFVCENNTFKLQGFEDASVDWLKFVEETICHINRHIALDSLRTVMEPRKDSLNPQRIEYELLHRAMVYDIKNSYPDFRNDLVTTLKRFIHRLRNNFSPNFKKITDQASYDAQIQADPSFKQFVEFLQRLRSQVIKENYPDAPYESVFPLLEAVRVVYESFNDQPFYFRKKTRFEG